MALKDRVADALKQSGRTAAELARACSVKPPSITGWLNGDSLTMRAETALRAARFLGVNVEWLVEGEGPMRASTAVESLGIVQSDPVHRLLAFAAQKGMNQPTLARAMGVSPQMVTNWKRRGLPLAQFKAAADAVGRTVDELVTGVNSGRRVDQWLFRTVAREEWDALDPISRGIIEGEVRRMMRELAAASSVVFES